MTRLFVCLAILSMLVACGSGPSKEEKAVAVGEDTVLQKQNRSINLPEPFATKSASNFSNVIGWPKDKMPTAPAGFEVVRFADSLQNPRSVYVAPNGDIFIAQANTEVKGVKKVAAVVTGKSNSVNTTYSANNIILFRDKDGDGKYEERHEFLKGLNQPFGILVLNNSFYVANTDGVVQYPYTPGTNNITSAGKKIVMLPAGGYNNHWTRNLLAAKDGASIFITVGSGSNVAEHGLANEVRRADVLQVNADGTNERIYASGLRNPVGIDYAPGTDVLWTAVNERDELGDELVPDYMTSLKEGGFYGWPFSYYGQHEDPRMKDKQQPEMVKKAIVPDVPLGAHTASLGLAFDAQNKFPGKFNGGAFVAQHGSWNRSTLSGYKVMFVPFKDGKASGEPEDFLTGFISGHENDVYGRPVDVAFTKEGNMLVTDDVANIVWLVKPSKL
jgi:glucose/arabinose dehydrogenase